MELPKRKNIRLRDCDYSLSGAYFVTICTARRHNYFWDNVGADNIRPQDIKLSTIGEIVEKSVLEIPNKYDNISVDKYCIMPDHIHLILRIESDDNGRIISAPTISTVVGSMKRWVSRQTGTSVWQKSFYNDYRMSKQQSFYCFDLKSKILKQISSEI